MRQEGFLDALAEAHRKNQPFAVATVIRVEGSASARTGSKAILNYQGKNDFGWVGGGCAEKFVGENATQAIEENQTRIVTAILDDEIFGLGVACGGKMDVFIEPVLPKEILQMPRLEGLSAKDAEYFAASRGWQLEWQPRVQQISSFADFLILLAQSLVQTRNRTGLPLRELKNLPVRFVGGSLDLLPFACVNVVWPLRKLVLVGKSRIVESLAKLGVQLGWSVRVLSPSFSPDSLQQNSDSERFPAAVICECIHDSYDHVGFHEGECVVIASHLPVDALLVQKALEKQAVYVAMIGSRTRALEVCEKLNWSAGSALDLPFFLPAGLDMDARNPDEIALSVICEILLLKFPTRVL